MPDDTIPIVHGKGGAYRIWPADGSGALINPPSGAPDDGPRIPPNPTDPNATEIFFGLLNLPGSPQKEQIELQIRIERVLRVVKHLFLHDAKPRPDTFRCYYVRLFHLAQLGLEGPNAAPDMADDALDSISADLIEDEAGRVKNNHLRKLGRYAALYSLPFLCLYVVVSLSDGGVIEQALRRLHMAPLVLANFCLLWVGCFHGVWLSYGIRKARITLDDLVATDEDRLLPQMRLIFAGSLTCAAGLMLALGFIDLKIGSVSLAQITSLPMLAYLVGMFFGIGELALPASIGSKAGTLAGAIK